MLALMAISMAFVACNKESNDDSGYVIDAKNVVGMTDNIATVNAGCMYNITAPYEYEVGVIATAEFKDQGFELLLPKIFENKYLIKPPVEESIVVSDPNAKISSGILLSAYNMGGAEIGNFFLSGKNNNATVTVSYIYADRNFSMKGNSDNSQSKVEINCSLKRGWNMMYAIVIVNEDNGIVNALITTKEPTNVILSWQYYPEGILESQFQNPIFKYNLNNKR